MPIEVILDSNNVDTVIIDNEDLYYYYENWQANNPTHIHKAKCRRCNYGFGFRETHMRGANGVWIGPFATLDLAKQYVESRGFQPTTCNNCL